MMRRLNKPVDGAVEACDDAAALRTHVSAHSSPPQTRSSSSLRRSRRPAKKKKKKTKAPKKPKKTTPTAELAAATPPPAVSSEAASEAVAASTTAAAAAAAAAEVAPVAAAALSDPALLLRLLQRDVSLSGSDVQSKRKAAMGRLHGMLFADSSSGGGGGGVDDATLNAIFPDLMKPLLKRLADPVERCRDLAATMLCRFVAVVLDLGRALPYFFPALMPV